MNPRTGEEVFPGVEPGSEPRWTVNAGGPRPLGMSDDFFKYVVFKDANWDFHTLDVAKHLELARKADGGIVSPTSPDIRPFVSRGAKLIIYHGWGDTNVPPRSSVNYHKRLVETLGAVRDRSIGAALYGSGHGSLRRRRGPQRVRCAHGARGMAREGESAGGNPRVEARRRARGADSTTLPLSTNRAVQGIRQHRRGQQLRLPNSMTLWPVRHNRMNGGFVTFGLVVWLAALDVSMSAHHSMAMYDMQKNITVTGIVARIELKNPHSLFYITVTDKDGKQAEWMLECQPLATLTTYGWSASTMKVGDKITAVGSPARNGKLAMLVRAIQLPDGRSIRT